MARAFRSLANPNYRLWAIGALVSNVGTWMQRTGQDWLILAELTDHRATAVGWVMALQFGPQIVLLPLTGFAADYFERRKLLFVTQALTALLALGLGVLTLTGLVREWHVYVFAGLLGCVSAFDAPARQTFVSDLVGEGDLSNAVALNSTSFNAARLVGPAAAGALVVATGSGWVFVLNALSYLPVLGALFLLKTRIAAPSRKGRPARGGFIDGFLYVWSRPDLKTMLAMLFLLCTFGLNFPIFISTMALSVFHTHAGGYGLLSSVLAVGSVTGALLAARRAEPHVRFLLIGAAAFGIACCLAAFAPNELLFGAALVLVGLSAQTFTTSTNSLIQLRTDPAMRGRVVAILLAVSLGGTPIGAPLVGWVADLWGPRWSLAVAAASGFAAAAVAVGYLIRHRGLRLTVVDGRPRLRLDPSPHR
jgi:MFS family permease